MLSLIKITLARIKWWSLIINHQVLIVLLEIFKIFVVKYLSRIRFNWAIGAKTAWRNIQSLKLFQNIKRESKSKSNWKTCVCQFGSSHVFVVQKLVQPTQKLKRTTKKTSFKNTYTNFALIVRLFSLFCKDKKTSKSYLSNLNKSVNRNFEKNYQKATFRPRIYHILHF